MDVIPTFINERILPLFFSYRVENIRKDFPFFNPRNGKAPLHFLDNASTLQKPQVVIDRITKFYERENSNIHRGIYTLSEKATEYFENARNVVAAFIGAHSRDEIIFTSGTTESINMVAQGYRELVGKGDEVLISEMEHHSNIIPWQMLCNKTGAVLKAIPVTQKGELAIEKIDRLITKRTKILALTHVSNALGTINPVQTIIELAHSKGVPVLIDGAKAVGHIQVNMADLDADYYAFSGHKLGSPTGIGVLFIKKGGLSKLQPTKGGGGMIIEATTTDAIYKDQPHGFEAGTPHIAGALGLEAAITYISSVGISNITAYEHKMTSYAQKRLFVIPGVKRAGDPKHNIGIISFLVDAIHPHDVGTFLSEKNVAIRTGHHCAMPLMNRLGVSSTVRASLALYTTKQDIDALVEGIIEAKSYFSRTSC